MIHEWSAENLQGLKYQSVCCKPTAAVSTDWKYYKHNNFGMQAVLEHMAQTDEQLQEGRSRSQLMLKKLAHLHFNSNDKDSFT